jgi:hypothetical protein
MHKKGQKRKKYAHRTKNDITGVTSIGSKSMTMCWKGKTKIYNFCVDEKNQILDAIVAMMGYIVATMRGNLAPKKRTKSTIYLKQIFSIVPRCIHRTTICLEAHVQ